VEFAFQYVASLSSGAQVHKWTKWSADLVNELRVVAQLGN